MAGTNSAEIGFEKEIWDACAEKMDNQLESDHLAAISDVLLPRLMSGEIEVMEALP